VQEAVPAALGRPFRLSSDAPTFGTARHRLTHDNPFRPGMPMSPTTRLALGGAVAVVAFDAVAAWAASRFGFDDAMATAGSCLLYLVIGFAAARVGTLRSAALAGALAGLAGASAGWFIARRIGPERLAAADLSPGRWAVGVAAEVLLAVVIASVGGLGGRSARERRARGAPRG